jgi:hypothetical protein
MKPEEKIGPSLRDKLQNDPPEQDIRVNVLLRADVSADQAMDAVRAIEASSARRRVSFLPSSRTVTAEVRLGDVPLIAARSDVSWVDEDHEAPIESLIDSA